MRTKTPGVVTRAARRPNISPNLPGFVNVREWGNGGLTGEEISFHEARGDNDNVVKINIFIQYFLGGWGGIFTNTKNKTGE